MPTASEQMRFLVVDDNEDIREVFARIVERAGHHASTAADGVEAVEAVQREPYDVMLLDLSMPRMTGLEVVQWLRTNDEVAPTMRVIVVSAWTGDHRRELDDLGVDRVLEKPVHVAQLKQLIAELAAA
ncbi:response regulator [Nocardioides KLBMP 9356]|uniref:Response regulator n=1 Tax=Nocardioides potassii TaxID=2911371 RepID=A0ABS9H7D7_9ACTN|nr:response regulator [Nocardioides potassii]MCF6376364.1 response regulator [Nocardioides potassii]